MNLRTTQLLVREIFQNPLSHQWSMQGLGMLRLYLGKEARVHIWDSSLRVPNVTAMHDHSWDLSSTILAGKLANIRYVRRVRPDKGVEWTEGTIVCGYDACLLGEKTTRLEMQPAEYYYPGDTYTQRAEEVHETVQLIEGTTTIMFRDQGDLQAHGHVFYPVGERWVDAKPRPATPEEVVRVTTRALEVLESALNHGT